MKRETSEASLLKKSLKVVGKNNRANVMIFLNRQLHAYLGVKKLQESKVSVGVVFLCAPLLSGTIFIT